MPPDPLPMHYRSIPGGGLEALAAATKPSSDPHSLDLTFWTLFGRACGCRGPSVNPPIWRVVRPRAVGTSILDHDVFGTGWQTMGRAMQSITIIVPVWQCGHSRKDRPVSIS
jgi:hypothetical protein